MGVTGAVWLTWDIFVAFFNTEVGDTFSRRVQYWTIVRNHPTIPFFVAFIFGSHFFWPGDPLFAQPYAFLTALAFFLCLGVAEHMQLIVGVHPMIPFVLGLIMGRLFFPMSWPT